ncbi:MAG: putative HTH-type transcriptional regulator [Acidimicrobiales bacterium]|nr:MAG: TetR/AcrR family transcriptional regulator [Actinomycetota bacterium]MBV6508987.1 putative HTH-type transcriptional regulator [Acidimicrobiales bacterium]RIK06298.1 MAG: hypothetical protein DCC48_07680 [Acidobacteriota bacterium]
MRCGKLLDEAPRGGSALSIRGVKPRRLGRPPNAPSRAARREELLSAAVAVIRRDGSTTSMESIAAEAGVTKPVVYAHFGDKAGLSAALARHVADELVGRVIKALEGVQGLQSTVTATVEAFVSFVEADPDLFGFLLYPSAGRSPNEDVRSLIETLALRMEPLLAAEMALSARPGEAGVTEPQTDPDTALRIRAVLGLAYTAVDWWIGDGNRRMNRTELVETVSNLVIGVLTEPG